MRFINTILSLIFLLLSSMPCADGEQNGSSEKVTINNGSGQHHDNDACSPLCVCSCCGCQGFAYNTISHFNFTSVKIIIDKKVPEYKSLLASTFYGSIWQPPQINA